MKLFLLFALLITCTFCACIITIPPRTLTIRTCSSANSGTDDEIVIFDRPKGSTTFLKFLFHPVNKGEVYTPITVFECDTANVPFGLSFKKTGLDGVCIDQIINGAVVKNKFVNTEDNLLSFGDVGTCRTIDGPFFGGCIGPAFPVSNAIWFDCKDGSKFCTMQSNLIKSGCSCISDGITDSIDLNAVSNINDHQQWEGRANLVAIQQNSFNKHIWCEGEDFFICHVNETTAGVTEDTLWILKENNDGSVSFKSLANGKFLGTFLDRIVVASSDVKTVEEKWIIGAHEDGVSLTITNVDSGFLLSGFDLDPESPPNTAGLGCLQNEVQGDSEKWKILFF